MMLEFKISIGVDLVEGRYLFTLRIGRKRSRFGLEISTCDIAVKFQV